MDWNAPIAVTVAGANLADWKRMRLFFGHYDTRFYLTEKAYVDVGAGSISAAKLIRNAPDGYAGSLGSIGRYSEFAECVIMSSGDHENRLPVNIGFRASTPMLASAAGPYHGAILPHKPINIGNAVVVSYGAVVLPGVRIGDGAVIGALSLVNKDVEDFSIVAGVPARKLSERLNTETAKAVKSSAWWDWPAGDLHSIAPDLQAQALTVRPSAPTRPRFVFHLLEGGEKPRLVGFARGEEIISFSSAPDAVRQYVSQALSPEPKYWLADCWA